MGDWNFQSNISQVKRGELTEEMLDRQYSDPVIVYERYNGNLETRMIISAKAKKGILKNKLFLELEGQRIDWKNAGFDPYDSGRMGKDISKFSINLGLTASTQILFNYSKRLFRYSPYSFEYPVASSSKSSWPINPRP